MPADRRTSSTTEQRRKSCFSTRPVNEIGLDPRRTNGGSVTPEYQNTGPSPEVLQLHQRADQLQLELERTKQALQLQQRADQLQLELERTKKDLSLTKQGFELDGVFGNKADIVSETNIINKVKFLNDCIYQLASAVADAHVDNAIQLSENQPCNNAKSLFGESLCNFVVDAKQNSTHPRILVSLQACMNHFCVLVLSSEFYSLLNPEKTQKLQQILDAIMEIQPARWRELVYSDKQASQALRQTLFSVLIRRLIHLLSRLYGFPEKQLQSIFEEDFSNLVKETMDLWKMMDGDYVSVFAPSPGSEFDPEKMQADGPIGRMQVAGPIMCTTAIGITQTLYIRRRRQGGGWVDEEEHNVLCRANVVVSFDD